jgi:ProQ/FINO family
MVRRDVKSLPPSRPARNSNEHERAIADRKLREFRAKQPPGLPPLPPPLPTSWNSPELLAAREAVRSKNSARGKRAAATRKARQEEPRERLTADTIFQRKVLQRNAAERVISLLCTAFPKAFNVHRRRPLKVGVYYHIVAVLDGTCSDDELRRALACYTGHGRYLNGLCADAKWRAP